MGEFNYIKWVTDHKKGLLTEQTGSGSTSGSAGSGSISESISREFNYKKWVTEYKKKLR